MNQISKALADIDKNEQPPIYGAPTAPQLDQCWFDTSANIFRVYTQQGWAVTNASNFNY